MDNTVNLGIDFQGTFRPEEAVTLREVAKLLRGRRGRLNLDVCRRWAVRGCHPAGERGPLLILPTIKWNGIRMAMPEWIEAFERVRIQLASSLPIARPQMRSRRAATKAYQEAVANLQRR